MERPTTTILRIGAWRVDPNSGQISKDDETVRLEARTMRLLLFLAAHPGEVVSIDDLLDQVWSGVNVSQDSVYQAVASLRRTLGDDSRQPTYIATVPRLGYRMLATVSPWTDRAAENQSMRGSKSGSSPGSHRPNAKLIWTSAGLSLAVIALLIVYLRIENGNHTTSPALAAQSQKSIAVLPFLDLTEGMHEETFADGMTEELIDKFSKVHGLQVAAPTSSFYYKDKQVSVADIAKALNVAYVVDGSIRKSGTRLRVAARLVRAENGYVVWSETYDRPFDDLLMVQEDIATEVTKALKASIDTGSR